MGANDSVNVEFWTRLEDGRIECGLCPRFCKMRPGQRGLCFVRRAREDGEGMELTGYGRSTGFCVDPIEKKPLNHFLPGSSVLSFGTAGCNLACGFCQNWDISKSRETARLSAHATPETIARAADGLGCASVAYTYNDPVVFMEYALDTAEACRARGVRNVAVTAGFVCEEPRKRLFAGMDAANVDLKAFTERFYAKRCAGALAPVLDTLKYLVHETNVWTEVTTLLIPGENDSDEELEAMTRWFARELKRDVPLHFTPSTPTITCWRRLRRLRRRCSGRARSRSRTGFITSMSAMSTIRRGRRRSARLAGRGRSSATATRSRATRSTPPALA
jgi:pyruvate formate lyase activating enzyme